MRLDPVLLDILVCPDCKGTLTVDQDNDELICDSCGLTYPVRDNIPVMLVDEARRPAREDDVVPDAPQDPPAAPPQPSASDGPSQAEAGGAGAPS